MCDCERSASENEMRGEGGFSAEWEGAGRAGMVRDTDSAAGNEAAGGSAHGGRCAGEPRLSCARRASRSSVFVFLLRRSEQPVMDQSVGEARGSLA